ncbi:MULTISPECIES: MogA/MoaB family molybdenum cofactor biosynthesis protein [Romboutsia]|uniref:Molybdenum cofactor biosynthesis protein MoaB n=1 Tax=Romboutsia hominis TaxID=1507512 RepID=A0A2P2BSU5_9FIRM|nr:MULTISPECIES: MogA/MoaB family molybdenum cofactor biosynthesis protein [Romboutsia]MCH1960679.1 MogA/MoaB family molybdenum cofactor biosynthesis protein [Romboutsia hominis]MCH1968889.1 MogA/MoaB family molybdenum cofactor biosynthesis protein [Romboutsia hominis]MDB8804232.1 MogA/MoaB family molybdenum cofactor biosynthesis protein [Romboutsia sp. 1001216sp1]MDB8808812.1 MogA/MoaB family molybdenum cofactor biosynthesis protein [Romboutsia sp. 1001216sp1]MDB8809878.1 MogA/MoaB family mol
MFKVAIVTLSDKGYIGEREDITGKKLKEYIEENNEYKVVHYNLLKDDKGMLKEELINICDNNIADLVLTNGGTGFSKRDTTPEATKEVLEREIPGISEYMRLKSSEITKKAILSRGISGIRNNSIIINLPGSPKGAIENLGFVLDVLPHGIEILKGEATECAITTKNSI